MSAVGSASMLAKYWMPAERPSTVVGIEVRRPTRR